MNELIFAAKSKLRSENMPEAAAVLTEALSSSEQAKTMLNAYKQPSCSPYNEKEALALLVRCQLKKEQYKLLRLSAKTKGLANNFIVLTMGKFLVKPLVLL